MQHHILPGSMEFENPILRAGVHTGNSEWEIKNLRYIKGDISKYPDKTASAQDFLAYVYDNSVGCLVSGGFKLIS